MVSLLQRLLGGHEAYEDPQDARVAALADEVKGSGGYLRVDRSRPADGSLLLMSREESFLVQRDGSYLRLPRP